MDKGLTKIKDLNPQTKQANVLARVVSLGERKTIQSKFGGARDLVEAVVGDETGTIIMTLWQDQIGQVMQDDTMFVENGYVSLVRGHMRLNCGKYGKLSKSEQIIGEVNTALDMSAAEYEQERRYRGGSERSERPDYGRDFSRGYSDRRVDLSRQRGRDRRRRR